MVLLLFLRHCQLPRRSRHGEAEPTIIDRLRGGPPELDPVSLELAELQPGIPILVVTRELGRSAIAEAAGVSRTSARSAARSSFWAIG